MIYLFELALKAYIAVLKWAVRSAARLLLGIRDFFLWACQSVREKPWRLIGILLVLLLLGVLAAVGRREWFLNWPVMLTTALALYGALKSPLWAAPSFLRKIVKLGTASCLVLVRTAPSSILSFGRTLKRPSRGFEAPPWSAN